MAKFGDGTGFPDKNGQLMCVGYTVRVNLPDGQFVGIIRGGTGFYHVWIENIRTSVQVDTIGRKDIEIIARDNPDSQPK